MTASILTTSLETKTLYQGMELPVDDTLRKVDSHLWRCISSHNGIFTFELKDEFKPLNKTDKKYTAKRVKKVLKKIYPAIELPPKQTLESFNFDYCKKSLIQLYITGLFHPLYEWIDGDEKTLEMRVQDKNLILSQIKLHSGDHQLGQELVQEFSSIDMNLSREELDNLLKSFTKKLKPVFRDTLDDQFPFEKNLCEFFNQLGFSSKKEQGTVFFTFPSVQELQERWKNIKLSYPHLPELSIYISEGVASDLEFVKAYLSHDVLISTGNEMSHDTTIHFYQIIRIIYENFQFYQTKKASIVQEAKKIYDKIIFAKHHLTQMGGVSTVSECSIQKLEVCLGMAVDILSTYRYFKKTPIESEEDFYDLMIYTWSTSFKNRPFFQNRFKGEIIDFSYPVIRETLDSIDKLMKAAQAPSEVT